MAGVRRLTLADVDAGLALSTASGWNQTADDWRRALSLPGTAGWGIEHEGELVSTTTAIRYGRELAWIGMVLTAERFRGQGFASQLMGAAIEALSDCALIKLDATAQGAPLYRRFGFEDECEIVRYVGRPMPGPVRLGEVRGPDAFEGNRTELLASLGSPACLPDGSFAYGRPGRTVPFFGPCVGDGEPLLRWFASKHEGEFMFDRIGEAPAGFRPARRLMRMYRGTFVKTDPRQYAFAGFEFG